MLFHTYFDKGDVLECLATVGALRFLCDCFGGRTFLFLEERKMKKKLLAIILVIALIISICPLGMFTFTASAETVSGTCGTNLTWQYDTSTYTLTISGTGAMNDYSY